MSRRVPACALVCAVAVALPAALAVAEPSFGPAAASASLNACGEEAGTLGVRVAAPYRAQDLTPWVRIQAQWYSSSDGQWRPIGSGGDSGWYRAGARGTGSESGYTFPFAAPRDGHQLVMRGVAEVQWRGDHGRSQQSLAVTSACQLRGA
jgi:hypothetical protein